MKWTQQTPPPSFLNTQNGANFSNKVWVSGKKPEIFCRTKTSHPRQKDASRDFRVQTRTHYLDVAILTNLLTLHQDLLNLEQSSQPFPERSAMRTLFFSVFCSVLLSPAAHADELLYEFTGFIPDGTSSHSMIADGETFTATFLIDDSVADSNVDSTNGLFSSAILSGSLEFSGGFAASLDFSGLSVSVGDNVGDVTSLDVVQIGGGIGLVIQVVNFVDLDSLQSDALPNAGTAFQSATSDSSDFFFVQLFYTDEFGSVLYSSADSVNTTFLARNVPEPSAVFMIVGLALGWTGISRRR